MSLYGRKPIQVIKVTLLSKSLRKHAVRSELPKHTVLSDLLSRAIKAEHKGESTRVLQGQQHACLSLKSESSILCVSYKGLQGTGCTQIFLTTVQLCYIYAGVQDVSLILPDSPHRGSKCNKCQHDFATSLLQTKYSMFGFVFVR